MEKDPNYRPFMERSSGDGGVGRSAVCVVEVMKAAMKLMSVESALLCRGEEQASAMSHSASTESRYLHRPEHRRIYIGREYIRAHRRP